MEFAWRCALLLYGRFRRHLLRRLLPPLMCLRGRPRVTWAAAPSPVDIRLGGTGVCLHLGWRSLGTRVEIITIVRRVSRVVFNGGGRLLMPFSHLFAMSGAPSCAGPECRYGGITVLFAWIPCCWCRLLCGRGAGLTSGA